MLPTLALGQQLGTLRAFDAPTLKPEPVEIARCPSPTAPARPRPLRWV